MSFEREVLTTPDGDDLVLDHLHGPAGAPRVVLLHGLEGSSQVGLRPGAGARASRGGHARHRAELPLVRARSGERPARCDAPAAPVPLGRHARTSTSSSRRWRSASRARRCYAVGFSLGGNVLLKWLGEKGARSRHRGRRDDLGAVRPRGGVAAPRARASRASTRRTSSRRSSARPSTCSRASRARPSTSTGDRIRFARDVLPVRRRRDGAAARLPERDRLLPQVELAALPRRHRGADAVREQRGRSVPARRGAAGRARGAPRRTCTFAVRPWGGHASFALGPLALARALLGRGARRELARGPAGVKIHGA